MYLNDEIHKSVFIKCYYITFIVKGFSIYWYVVLVSLYFVRKFVKINVTGHNLYFKAIYEK